MDNCQTCQYFLQQCFAIYSVFVIIFELCMCVGYSRFKCNLQKISMIFCRCGVILFLFMKLKESYGNFCMFKRLIPRFGHTCDDKCIKITELGVIIPHILVMWTFPPIMTSSLSDSLHTFPLVLNYTMPRLSTHVPCPIQCIY